MKKLLVILAMVVLMFASVPAFASDCCDTMDKAFSLKGDATVGINEIPWQHALIYKHTEDDVRLLWKYQSINGRVEAFAWLFGRVAIIRTYFVDEKIFLEIQDWTRRGGQAWLLMATPYSETHDMVLIEQYGDGDLLVDAVALRNLNTNSFTVLHYADTSKGKIPSIYSSVFKKHLSKLTHKYAYEMDIDHATIEMGEIIPEITEQN